MFCGKCGASFGEGIRYCPRCGQAVDPYAGKPQPNLLVWGILSLAFAVFGPSFVGIIFAVIGRKKQEEYDGILTGPSRVGAGLIKAGYITGIIMTVVHVLLIVLYIALFGFLFANWFDQMKYLY